MQTMMDFLQQDWINSLGWTLLHSLWQYALIATVCALILFFTKPFSANFRYLIALSSLAVGILISAITFYKYQQASIEIIIKPSQQNSAVQFFTENNGFNLVSFIENFMNSVVIAWLFGFLIYSLKIFLDYRYCQHLKNQHLSPTPEKWQRILTELAAKVGITSAIELRISTLTIAPCVIGHLKPVVLLPMGLLLGMNQQQIEVILLHELAHVRRNDYLLGLMQAIIKTLFFFNPFLHWISRQIDKEREHACDDIAVTISQNPLLFANTLKEFADMNINSKSAMNITGNKLLLTRVTRLFTKQEHTTNSKNSFLATLLILFTSLIVTVCVNATPNNAADKIISIDIDQAPIQEVMAEANKKCGTNEQVVSSTNSDKITLHVEDIECSKIMGMIKSFAATPKEQQVSIKFDNLSLKEAMAIVNQQCGTSETVSEENSQEKISFKFQEMSCETIMMMMKDFDKN